MFRICQLPSAMMGAVAFGGDVPLAGGAGHATGAAEEALHNVQAVATAANELSRSNQEIGDQVHKSSADATSAAATGTRDVAENIADIAAAAGKTGIVARRAETVARSLREYSQSLDAVVGRFLDGVRAA